MRGKGTDESITLKLIFKQTGCEDVDRSQAAQWKSLLLGFCMYGNEHMGYVIGIGFINLLSDHQLLKNYSSSWSWSLKKLKCSKTTLKIYSRTLQCGSSILLLYIWNIKPSQAVILNLDSHNGGSKKQNTKHVTWNIITNSAREWLHIFHCKCY